MHNRLLWAVNIVLWACVWTFLLFAAREVERIVRDNDRLQDVRLERLERSVLPSITIEGPTTVYAGGSKVLIDDHGSKVTVD